jgi:hypothetical protein
MQLPLVHASSISSMTRPAVVAKNLRSLDGVTRRQGHLIRLRFFDYTVDMRSLDHNVKPQIQHTLFPGTRADTGPILCTGVTPHGLL